ncbi:MAG TPA: rhodanese-like domain-containing protein [Pyrinomonadaceae bacterium]|jgi:rhodanese-related sulfurtransferase
MNNLSRRVGLFANIAIIVVALLLCVVLVKRHLMTGGGETVDHSAEPSNELRVGSKLPLANIDWAKNSRTLLLALSKDCHFCSESASFYQRLAQASAERGNIQLIAILPETVNDGQKYLSDLGVTTSEVRQVSFNAIGVRRVPALILVDNTGVVTDIWQGKLVDSQEFGVLSRLQLNNSARDPQLAGKNTQPIIDNKAETIGAADLKRLLDSGQRVVLLDVRERSAYASSHIPGAKNIPVDELEARAINELPPSDLIVAYCHCANDSLSQLARKHLLAQGFQHVVVLRAAG